MLPCLFKNFNSCFCQIVLMSSVVHLYSHTSPRNCVAPQGKGIFSPCLIFGFTIVTCFGQQNVSKHAVSNILKNGFVVDFAPLHVCHERTVPKLACWPQEKDETHMEQCQAELSPAEPCLLPAHHCWRLRFCG